MEAPPGFEPGMEVLQTSALPLGDGAGYRGADEEPGEPQKLILQTRRARASAVNIAGISDVVIWATLTCRKSS
jgi:hypothetical protein